MTRFDTLKLKVHSSCAKIKGKHQHKLTARINQSTWKFEPLSYLQANFPPGIGMIAEGDGKVVFEVSSKVLGPGYVELIHRDSFKDVMWALSEYLDFGSEAEVVGYAEVCRCHVTENIPIARPVHEYLLPLACVSNPDFKTVAYKGKEVSFEDIARMKERKLQTVIFKKSYKNGKDNERLMFYDKVAEMERGKSDRFYANLPNLEEVREYFGKHLRAEMQLSSHEGIRKAFKVAEPRLRLILDSIERPLYDLFERVRNGSKPSATEHYPSKSSFNRLEKELGMEKLIADCRFDVNLIKQHFNRHIKGTPSLVMRRYRRKAEEMKRRMLEISEGLEKGLLGEIADYLKAA